MLVDGLDPLARFAIVAGSVLLVIALVWRSSAVALTRRRLTTALASPDPDERRSAIAVATSQGLGRHVRALTKLMEHESDDRVLEALELGIARSLWEPADTQGILALRLWAEERRRSGQPVTSSQAAMTAPLRMTIAPSDDERTCTVMVSGAGGPAGISVIRALVGAGHDVVAIDADPLAAGLFLAPKAEVIVPADHPDFVDQVIDVARVHHVDAFIPTIAEEMAVLIGRRDDVASRVAVWLPDEHALADCLDKWRFARAMVFAGISVPETTLPEGRQIPGPWVVKPRSGRGSHDVRFVDRPEDLGPAIRVTPHPIVQTRACGSEFSVDALVSRDGEVVGAVPRWRLETKAGISTKGRTFSDARVIDGTTAVLAALGLCGAVNVQGFVDGDDVTFIEVNPRFSGGLPLSLAAGADLVGEYLRGVLELPMRPERLTFEPGTTMVRHLQEIYP